MIAAAEVLQRSEIVTETIDGVAQSTRQTECSSEEVRRLALHTYAFELHGKLI